MRELILLRHAHAEAAGAQIAQIKIDTDGGGDAGAEDGGDGAGGDQMWPGDGAAAHAAGRGAGAARRAASSRARVVRPCGGITCAADAGRFMDEGACLVQVYSGLGFRGPALAREIADNTAPVSVAITRQLLYRMAGASHPMEAHKVDSKGIYSRGKSDDVKEGVTAFLEKRPAEFRSKASEMPDFGEW